MTRLALLLLMLSAIATAQEPAAQQLASQREQLLEQMRGLAKATDVRLANAAGPAELVPNPIFRYDDQPRRFIDATIWAWTDGGGRPVAFQKIEAVDYGDEANPSPLWQYCLASLSSELVTAKWPGGRQFRSQAPGIEFRTIAKSPAVADTTRERRRQARELVRQFSARIVTDSRDDIHQEMRLLTTPLFEYADPKTKAFRGAVYGFSTNGTNPDLLVLIEARGDGDKSAWHFAPARMTTGKVTLKCREAQVWECAWVNSRQTPLLTWSFFTTARGPAQEDK